VLLPCPRDLPREIDRTPLFVVSPVITLALLATVEDELAGVLEIEAGLAAEAADLWVLEEVRHVLLAAGPVAGAGDGAGAACVATLQRHGGRRLAACPASPAE